VPEDLKTLLERAEAPAMHVDAHAVLAGGRRRHRRRAVATSVALAATVGVLGVGAATVGDLGRATLPPASVSSTTAPAPSATTSPAPEPVTALVKVEVGHCWVEDVVFDGQAWGLTRDDQFGRGGSMPLPWAGTGVMVRLSVDQARYTDDDGAVLNFLPVDDPRVFRKQGLGCM
jgi:hypothetical protein